VQIAAEAGISEVTEAVSASVLFGYDVFDLKRREDVTVREAAVFAQSSRAFPDLLFGGLVHLSNLGNQRSSDLRAFK
jgi:hypothetical protein